MLIQRLRDDYGIDDYAIAWFESYLNDRDQIVKIGESLSEPVALETGVPQGRAVVPVHILDIPDGWEIWLEILTFYFLYLLMIHSCLNR